RIYEAVPTHNTPAGWCGPAGVWFGASERLAPPRGELELALVVNQPGEGFQEVLESARGQHDRVAAATDIFGDLQEPAALVFLQVQKKHLPINGHLFRGNRFGGHPGACIWVSLVSLFSLSHWCVFFLSRSLSPKRACHWKH